MLYSGQLALFPAIADQLVETLIDCLEEEEEDPLDWVVLFLHKGNFLHYLRSYCTGGLHPFIRSLE